MVIQKEVLLKIKEDFKLNIYEVKIWAALLSRGIATAAELADISVVPRSRCYDVLESLEKKGFIIMKVGKPIKYIAVQPEEIVERVKKDLKEKAEHLVLGIDELKSTDVFKELELLFKTGVEHVDATKISGSIVGRYNVYHYIKEMANKAKKTITICTTEQGFIRKVNALKNIIANLNKKGVKIKIIAPINEKIAKKAKILNLKNVELKDIDPKSRFVSVDNKEFLFMTNDDNVHPEYDNAIWVNSEFFAKSLGELFIKNM